MKWADSLLMQPESPVGGRGLTGDKDHPVFVEAGS